MAIPKIDKTKVMRPSLIDAVDTINLLIDAVEALDPSGLESRVSALETTVSGQTTRLDGLNTRTTNLENASAGYNTDITQIKATLYTPLNQSVPANS